MWLFEFDQLKMINGKSSFTIYWRTNSSRRSMTPFLYVMGISSSHLRQTLKEQMNSKASCFTAIAFVRQKNSEVFSFDKLYSMHLILCMEIPNNKNIRQRISFGGWNWVEWCRFSHDVIECSKTYNIES